MISAFCKEGEASWGVFFRSLLGGLLAALIVAIPFPVRAAPSVELKDFDGHTHNVNEFIGKGKWTVIEFWLHSCPICQRDAIQLEFFYDSYKNKGVRVLGVSVDGYAKQALARKFVHDQQLTFPNLIGTPQSVAEFGQGRLIGTPTIYVYDPSGRFVAKHVGGVTYEQVEALIKSRAAKGR